MATKRSALSAGSLLPLCPLRVPARCQRTALRLLFANGKESRGDAATSVTLHHGNARAHLAADLRDEKDVRGYEERQVGCPTGMWYSSSESHRGVRVPW